MRAEFVTAACVPTAALRRLRRRWRMALLRVAPMYFVSSPIPLTKLTLIKLQEMFYDAIVGHFGFISDKYLIELWQFLGELRGYIILESSVYPFHFFLAAFPRQ